MLQYDEWTEYDIRYNLFYDSLFDQTAKMLFILIKNNNKHNNDYINWQDDKWLMLKMINWTQITKIKID